MSEAISFKPLKHKDLLSIAQLSGVEIENLFGTAAAFKAKPQTFLHALEGKTIVLLFEKDSLRTLVSFEAGMAKLGGKAVYMDHRQARIGVREPIRDYAKNLERWVDAIVARTYEHSTISELAKDARIPVINALSNFEHPCQALADFFTLQEHFGGLQGLKLAYVGDGNNVAQSLLLGAAVLGVEITVITPPKYEPAKAVVDQAKLIARETGAAIQVTNDMKAVAGHNAVYTDTWISMGQEAEADQRLAKFKGYQVTSSVMKAASADSVFMHCLPAHRGQEVAADVIDSERSIMYDQSENRMHVQNALLLHLLASKNNKNHSEGARSRKRAAATA